jgi:hypothetical protein
MLKCDYAAVIISTSIPGKSQSFLNNPCTTTGLLDFSHSPLTKDVKLMMISDATAQIGPWPPFTGFMIVFIVRCGVISSTTDLF